MNGDPGLIPGGAGWDGQLWPAKFMGNASVGSLTALPRCRGRIVVRGPRNRVNRRSSGSQAGSHVWAQNRAPDACKCHTALTHSLLCPTQHKSPSWQRRQVAAALPVSGRSRREPTARLTRTPLPPPPGATGIRAVFTLRHRARAGVSSCCSRLLVLQREGTCVRHRLLFFPVPELVALERGQPASVTRGPARGALMCREAWR